MTPPRTHSSRTEIQSETNSFSEEQEIREKSASSVISLGNQEEEEAVRNTPYSPVRSAPISPLQSPTFPTGKPDDYSFLGARHVQSLEERISNIQSRSTSATSRVSQSPNSSYTPIPRVPRRQYDSYRPRRDQYRQRGRNQRRQPRLTREE